MLYTSSAASGLAPDQHRRGPGPPAHPSPHRRLSGLSQLIPPMVHSLPADETFVQISVRAKLESTPSVVASVVSASKEQVLLRSRNAPPVGAHLTGEIEAIGPLSVSTALVRLRCDVVQDAPDAGFYLSLWAVLDGDPLAPIARCQSVPELRRP